MEMNTITPAMAAKTTPRRVSDIIGAGIVPAAIEMMDALACEQR